MVPSSQAFFLLVLLWLSAFAESAEPGLQKRITKGSKFGLFGRGTFGLGLFPGGGHFTATVGDVSADPNSNPDPSNPDPSNPDPSKPDSGGDSSGSPHLESSRKILHDKGDQGNKGGDDQGNKGGDDQANKDASKKDKGDDQANKDASKKDKGDDQTNKGGDDQDNKDASKKDKGGDDHPNKDASKKDKGDASKKGKDDDTSKKDKGDGSKKGKDDDASQNGQGGTPPIGPDGNPITGPEKPRFESNSLGTWRIANKNAGVAAMQLQTMPNDKVVWFDTTFLGPSALQLKPPGNCPINFETNVPDCYVHAIEYDGLHDTVRPLTIKSDPWCSVGSLSATGTLIGTGGYYKGRNAIRLLKSCPNCDFTEKSFVLGSDRWYASQHILDDGNLVVVGGRKSFTYEIIPPDTMNIPIKKFDFPFLQQTTDPVENNLYPFLYLIPDGNLFLFANNRSIIFDHKTAKIVRELPPLPGGSRNYPASGMSAILPIKIDPKAPEKVYFDIMVCGGASPFAFFPVDSVQARPKPKNVYWPALQDCNKIKLMDPKPHWEKDMLLSPRVMGDMLILPTGDLLILNGAKKGTAGWWNGDDPNMTPELYMPKQKLGNRFKQLAPTNIPRMYHSTSAVLSSGEVLVAGSNENDRYVFEGVPFPTELRVEKFSPPYLDKSLDKYRPKILTPPKKVKHGGPFSFKYAITSPPPQPLEAADLKVHLLSPPFTTHGYSQQQRMLVLDVRMRGPDTVQAVAPPNARIAPPGYYIMFLVHRGVPSTGLWVRLVTI